MGSGGHGVALGASRKIQPFPLDCASQALPTMSFTAETRRRRTFAIISHPDAGKTTLTEKLLLFSGAIQIAGWPCAP